jgi:hypothetical protein
MMQTIVVIGSDPPGSDVIIESDLNISYQVVMLLLLLHFLPGSDVIVIIGSTHISRTR